MLLKKIVLCSLIIGGLFSTKIEAKSKEINLGYYNCDHMIAAPVGEKAGIYKDFGLNVKVSGNGNVPQAMIAGRMDAGYIGIGNVFTSVHRGVPLVVGANNHKGGSYYLVVANHINSPEELIGKRLAIGADPEKTTGWTQIAEKLGIPREGKNYQTISIGSGIDKVTALQRGLIDGFIDCDPWASYAEYLGAGKIMFLEKELNDGSWGICCAFTLSRKFIEERPEDAVKLIQAHQKSIEYVYRNPIKAAKIFADTFKIPYEVALMTIYKKTVGEGRTLTWKLDRTELENELKFVHEYKFQPEDVTYEKVANEEIYNKAQLLDFDIFIAEKIDADFPVGMAYDAWLKKATEIDG